MIPTPPVAQRFTSEEQIIAAIDKSKAKVERLRRAAERLDQVTDKLVQKGKTGLSVIEDRRDRADRKRSKACNIENCWLIRLKNDLAIFRTGLLPEMGDDRSIPQ